MLPRMHHRDLELRIGYGLAVVIATAGYLAAAFVALVLTHPAPSAQSAVEFWAAYALVLVYLLVAIVVHELGHVLAARLAGVRVISIQIGRPVASFMIRGVKVELGFGLHGRVFHGQTAAAARRAAIQVAGPAATILAALVLLIVPLTAAIRYPAALVFAVNGIANLLPFRNRRTGLLSDGARLVRGPRQRRAERDVGILLSTEWKGRPDAADTFLRGIQFEVPAAQRALSPLAGYLLTSGRIDDLRWLHRQRVTLPDSPPQRLVSTVHALEWAVASIPDLSLADANLAGSRMRWVVKHSSAHDRPIAQHTLAVVRLRQRLPAYVEDLCAPLLASSPTASRRASVLATLAMARHASGLSGAEALAVALELDPQARLVQEAASRLATSTSSRAGSRRSRRSALVRS